MNVALRTLSLALCIYLTQASDEQSNCTLFGPSQICAISKIGACGAPKPFDNFCELVKYNKENPDAGMFRFVFKVCFKLTHRPSL